MKALLLAELLKLRTTRTFLGIAGSAVALSLLIVVLITTQSEPSPDDLAQELAGVDLSTFFILILGVVGITGEWRHRTITSSLLAAPDRLRFLLAKVIAYAVAGAVLSLLINLLTLAVGFAILASQGFDVSFSVVFEAGWVNLATAALLGALGVGIGAVVRNQVVAVVLVLVVLFIVEPTLSILEPEVGRYTPFSAAAAFFVGDGELGRPGALLVVLAWIAALTALGGLLLRRRDLA